MWKEIILLSSLFLIVEINYAQNMSIPQTLDYINKKLQDNPSHDGDGTFTNLFSIELNANGELSILHKSKFDTDPWKIYRTTFYVSNASIASNCGEKNDQYPETQFRLIKFNSNDNSSCFRTTIVQSSNKKDYDYSSSWEIITFPESVRESLCNAFNHLFHLISTEPKYNQPKEIDPFADAKTTNKTSFNTSDSNEVVHMQKMQGGTYEIPVTINDVLKISFIFDTGASDVSISPDVALTLIRTGTVKETDFIGSQTYSFADGSKATSRRFIIRKLTIGNHTVTNVIASISKSINAPMLLGQSVQQKFGKIIIDNIKHTLKFTE